MMINSKSETKKTHFEIIQLTYFAKMFSIAAIPITTTAAAVAGTTTQE